MPNNPETRGGPRLMTVSEIAEQYEISRQAIHTYRRTGVFPQPVPGKGSTRLRFRADEVAAFFRDNPKQPGRRTDRAPQPQQGETMADELVAFLRERLKEDAEIARRPTKVDWGQPYWDLHEGESGPHVDLGTVHLDRVSSLNHYEMAHIARHDPARVLREVEAKRAILAAYEQAVATTIKIGENLDASAKGDAVPHPDVAVSTSGQNMQQMGLYAAVGYLAAAYADHPDYRPEWRP